MSEQPPEKNEGSGTNLILGIIIGAALVLILLAYRHHGIWRWRWR